jgi:hypothetical protein
MNKKNRKKIHHIAMAFNLKSKSTGSGQSRFPTLSKTAQSAALRVDEVTITQTLSRGKFSDRSDFANGGKRGGGGGGGGGGGHKEGDIVGAGAKEIAEDNRGRIMLEKMGYKPGTSLGADHNKGIAVPVAAVVKMGKAGLC